MILYDQPLGYNPAKGPESVLASFDTYYNNYYDAYFVADDTADNGFSWVGYGNKGADKTKLGGYGKWYLDPDGTIPFTEENMQNMPAGNIDVYYHYSKKECKIYFVDAITGKDLPPVDGIEHVINNQTLTPGTKAEHFNGDAPVDPSGELYFVGWFYDQGGTNPYSFDDEIPGDTIVYAIWRPNLPTEYKIRHVLVDENGKEIKHKKGIGEFPDVFLYVRKLVLAREKTLHFPRFFRIIGARRLRLPQWTGPVFLRELAKCDTPI